LRLTHLGEILFWMRWWIAWMGLVVGCFNPSAQPGLPCAANDACPSGQTCVVGVCRLDATGGEIDAGTDGSIVLDDAAPDGPPPPDGPPTDLDADGIANALDNCPMLANQDQHDEDADEVGDVCDNCPHVANLSQANIMEGGSADAVGDACDPNPTATGDTIARFIPFHVMPTGLTLEGSWMLTGDAFVKAGMGFGRLVVAGTRNKVTIEIGGSQISSATASSYLVATFGLAGGSFHHCGYDQSVDDYHSGVLGTWDGMDWDWIDVVNHYLPMGLAGAFKITVSADAEQNTASCTTADSRGIAATGVDATPTLQAGTVGIEGEDLSFQVDYIVVFGSI